MDRLALLHLKADERPSQARRNAELREIDNAIQRVRTFKEPDDAKKGRKQPCRTCCVRRKKKESPGREIARMVWPHDQSPSKRFDKLTIPREGNLDEDRVKRLQRRPSNYKEVARALGERVPGWSPNAALVRVFRSTSVDRELNAKIEDREARIADPDFCWRNLADMLDLLAELENL